MSERSLEPVRLERVRKDATCIITRVGLGGYELRGARENILIPESHVAYATVINDLIGEGYELVSSEEYAKATGIDSSQVEERIREGSLFAISYGDERVIPLPQKEAVLPDLLS